MSYRNETETLRKRVIELENELHGLRNTGDLGRTVEIERLVGVEHSDTRASELVSLVQEQLSETGRWVCYGDVTAWVSVKYPAIQVRIDEHKGQLRLRVDSFQTDRSNIVLTGILCLTVAHFGIGVLLAKLLSAPFLFVLLVAALFPSLLALEVFVDRRRAAALSEVHSQLSAILPSVERLAAQWSAQDQGVHEPEFSIWNPQYQRKA